MSFAEARPLGAAKTLNATAGNEDVDPGVQVLDIVAQGGRGGTWGIFAGPANGAPMLTTC
jgi:hypothetical protein